MSRLSVALCLLALPLALGGAAGRANAQVFTEVYFFGDSLSDTGLSCPVLGGLNSAYVAGRCSNGPVWSDLLALSLGTTTQEGSTNFAVGGSTTDNLGTQISLFEIATLFESQSHLAGALYVVWMGGNDIRESLDDPLVDLAARAAAVINGIEDLASGGGTTFLVPNAPDVGRAYNGFFIGDFVGATSPLIDDLIDPSGPFTPMERDAATLASLQYDSALDTALDQLEMQQPGLTIIRVDIMALLEQVFASPAQFGLISDAIDASSDDTAFGIPCLLDPLCASNPSGPRADRFFLFDAIHPTKAIHSVIADQACSQITGCVFVPEPSPMAAQALALATLSAAARLRRRRRRDPSAGLATARSPGPVRQL